MRGSTLRSSVQVEGVGVHSGARCTATLAPGDGRAFVVDGVRIPADLDHVVDTRMSTTLGLGAARVGQVEHLLSALAGLGVDGATIHVDGPELPFLDGSARGWVDAIRRAGIEPGAPPAPIAIDAPIDVEGARVEPGPPRLVVELTDPRVRGRVVYDGVYEAIMGARTFVFAADVERLLAAGYGAGATAANTLIVGDPDPQGPPREAVTHKLLDALGDLALLGRPIGGAVTLTDTGHRLHVELARRIAATL